MFQCSYTDDNCHISALRALTKTSCTSEKSNLYSLHNYVESILCTVVESKDCSFHIMSVFIH